MVSRTYVFKLVAPSILQDQSFVPHYTGLTDYLMEAIVQGVPSTDTYFAVIVEYTLILIYHEKHI